MKTLIVVILTIGEQVLKKSIPSLFLNPLATSLALNFSRDPSVLDFFLIHLHPIDLQAGCRSTNTCPIGHYGTHFTIYSLFPK